MSQTPQVENKEYTLTKQDLLKINQVYKGAKYLTSYLEPFVRESQEAYDYRIDNLTILNYMRLTVNNATNLLTRKPLTVSLDLSDVQTRSLNSLSKEISRSVIKDGCTYIVTDSPQSDAKTRAEEISQGIEPYLYQVQRENVPNWTYNDDGTYKHITINETYTVNLDYSEEIREQQRVFKDTGEVELWREGELYDVIYTDKNYVPVVKVGNDDLYLLDLAKINLNHMNRRSELNRYLNISGNPTPVIYGLENEQDITIGVDTAVTFSSKTDGGFEWVEISGKSAQMLDTDLKRLEDIMAEGSISLVKSSDTQKTATEVSIEASNDESVLTAVATQVEDGLNTALLMVNDSGGYNGVQSDLVVQMNRDYTTNILTPEQTQSYLTLYQNSVISHETLLELLVSGEVLPEIDITKEVQATFIEPDPVEPDPDQETVTKV